MATMANRLNSATIGLDHARAERTTADRRNNGGQRAMPYPAPMAPASVPGPFGKPLTLDMLPAPETRRWVVRRKAEVIAAINGGLLSATEACARYRISPEELELWQKAIDHAGVPGLRVTRIQLYRDDYSTKPARTSASFGVLPRASARMQ